MDANNLKYSQDYVDAQQAEIERLREAVKFLNSFRPDAELAKRDNEIEWLRNELAECERVGGKFMEKIERLRGLLADAPCTCENPPPHDWPHDPTNQECYLTRVREALGE